jgi:hypothetical protein
MKRREIAPEEWHEFFESFNGQHEGWLVDVERFEEFLDESVETRRRDGALRGVQLEGADASDEAPRIALAVDDKASGHLETEAIHWPQRIVLEQTEDDADAALQIDGAQSCLFLRFRVPTRADMVDGMV